ncbi:MAG: MATE family efflux transporter [Planctomycetes bacterium]|nr:MATE family efflux transporter [Planctomycetota bacterium]
MSTPLRRELSVLTRLAVPVAVTQLALMAMGVVDMLMLGHVGKEALGAAALANSWITGCQLVLQGFLFGIDPLVSQAHGAHDKRGVSLALQRGLILAGVAALLATPLALWTAELLELIRQDPVLFERAQAYATARIPGMLPFYVFATLRAWLQGRGIVRPALMTALVGNVVNAVANYGLIFGNLGLPELGVQGAGIATSCTSWAMLAALLMIIKSARLGRGGWTGWSLDALKLQGFARVLLIGFPIAAQLGLEIFAFQFSTFASGLLSITSLAAHTVVLNLCSITFMVPLGVAIAASTRVGNLIGAKRPEDAQRSAWTALGMGASAMACFAGLFVLLRHQLPALYGAEPEVAMLAALILPIAAAFQVFDGLQVIGGGILRGMATPKAIAWLNFFGYYGIGLPLSWYLAFHLGHGLPGIWWGLAVSLFFVAVGVCIYLKRRGPALATRDLASASGA